MKENTAPKHHAQRDSTSIVRRCAQVFGYAGGLALLVWSISLALSPDNRDQLALLRDAHWSSLGMLLALSFGSVVVNGFLFWIALVPLRRLPVLGVIFTNALATLLNFLPFKLSVASRVLVHARRDNVAVPRIGAWFAAVGTVMVCTLIPFTLVCRNFGTVDARSIGIGILSVGVTFASLITLFSYASRFIAHRAKNIPPKYNQSGYLRLGAGLTGQGIQDLVLLLRSIPCIAIGASLRFVDLALLSARMYIAADLLGIDIGWEHAVFLAGGHFLAGVLSPIGMVGSREAATIAMASAIGIANATSIAPLPLLVGVSELPVLLALCPFALIHLRFDRLLTMAADATARVDNPSNKNNMKSGKL